MKHSSAEREALRRQDADGLDRALAMTMAGVSVRAVVVGSVAVVVSAVGFWTAMLYAARLLS